MAEITTNTLEAHLKQTVPPAPVFLIFGEEYLYKSAFDLVVSKIVPQNQRAFNVEELEGTDDNVTDAIEQVNTFSLDGSAKVVGLVDAKIFYAKENRADLVEKIREAVAADRKTKAVAGFVKLIGLLDIALTGDKDLDKKALARALDDDTVVKAEWPDTLIDACAGRDLSASAGINAAEALVAAIEKGFAPNNHLVITTDMVDKRRKLYKAIKEHGVVVDCSVAKGASAADKKAQAATLQEVMRDTLKKRNKTMDGTAFTLLCETTGFDLRTFAGGLEKLCTYVGDRKAITAKDVKAVMVRTRVDPVFELTNAVGEKNTAQALFYLNSLLCGPEPLYPLQILAAIANQTRKLAVIRDFMESRHGKAWKNGMTFQPFKERVLPAIEAYDTDLQAQSSRRDAVLAETADKKTAKSAKTATDLTIGADARNLYPVYKTFEKAARFPMAELIAAFALLADTDRRLKSATDPQLALEHLVITLCRNQ